MKRWWLPTQKGTELFPRASVEPPKLVVEGTTPGSPLARQIAQRFSGQIKRFHGKCQQMYSLSTAQQMKLQGQWQGASAVYLNQGGHETITVKVDQSAQAITRRPSRPLPNWAQLEFTFPFTGVQSHWQMYAVIRDTEFDTFQTGAGITGSSIYFKPLERISFAGSASDKDGGTPAQTDPRSDRLTMQLIVDLRPYHTLEPHAGGPVIDIYGYTSKPGVGVPISYTSSFNGTITNTDWWTDFGFTAYSDRKASGIAQWGAAGFAPQYDVLLRDGVEVDMFAPISSLPSTSFVGSEPVYTLTTGTPASGFDGYRQITFTTDPTSGLVTFATSAWFLWRDSTGSLAIGDPRGEYYFDITVNTSPSSDWDVGPGTVAGVSMFDDPDWVHRRWNVPASSLKNYRWMPRSELGPDWRGLPVLDDALFWPVDDGSQFPSPGGVDDPDIFLGTIVCDLETNSVSFTPAVR